MRNDFRVVIIKFNLNNNMHHHNFNMMIFRYAAKKSPAKTKIY